MEKWKIIHILNSYNLRRRIKSYHPGPGVYIHGTDEVEQINVNSHHIMRTMRTRTRTGMKALGMGG